MGTVAFVAHVAPEGCFQGSLDDASGFHRVLLHPVSWPLCGLGYQGVDLCMDRPAVWGVRKHVRVPLVERG